jgi:hypothetical protein
MDKLREAFAKHNIILENMLFHSTRQYTVYEMVITIKNYNYEQITKTLTNLYNIGYIGQHTTTISFDQNHPNELVYYSKFFINFDGIEKLIQYLYRDYNFNIRKKNKKKFRFC